MMSDNERAVIEAAVEWGHVRDFCGKTAVTTERRADDLASALAEPHNEHDGKWEPSRE
jgi:hypothetical protein